MLGPVPARPQDVVAVAKAATCVAADDRPVVGHQGGELETRRRVNVVDRRRRGSVGLVLLNNITCTGYFSFFCASFLFLNIGLRYD